MGVLLILFVVVDTFLLSRVFRRPGLRRGLDSLGQLGQRHQIRPLTQGLWQQVEAATLPIC